MYKKWVYYVRSLVALSCIFCALFLNILHVSAQSPHVWSEQKETYIAVDNEYMGGSPHDNHFGIDSDVVVPFTTDYLISANGNYWKKITLDDFICSVTFNTGSGLRKVNDVAIYDSFGNLVTSINTLNTYDLVFNFSPEELKELDGQYLSFEVRYNVFLNSVSTTSAISYITTKTLCECSDILVSQSVQEQIVKDSNSDTIVNIQNDIKDTQDSIKETTEDTNETTHSIFDSISDFFGSFFSNLIGVFVPEDGYFSTWFNRVNTLLTNKLGILYYPFSVIIDIFTRLNTALSDSQQNTCPIYLPELGITIQGHRYVFLERQTVDLINYNIQLGNADTSNSSMFGLTSLIWVVRRFTSLVLVIAFLNMCVSKVKLIMRGSEEG